MSTQLENLENFISNKAQSVRNCRYAFSVILPEEKYNELIQLHSETRFENHDVQKYPWCHLKLLTETCARKFFFREEDEGKLEQLLAKELKIQNISYWKDIPGIITRLGLRQIRKEGKSWHIYAKIVLHSGVPSAYFEKIWKNVTRKFDSENNNLDRIVNKFCQDDFFKYENFSKFFKTAFESMAERKMLFQWFVRLVDISNHTDGNISEKLGGHFPPHLIDCIKTRKDDGDETYGSGKIKDKYETSKRGGLIFNYDRGIVEYIFDISQKISWEASAFPTHWKKSLEKVEKCHSSRLSLPINPSDLGRKNPFNDKIPIFKFFSRPVEAIVFDSNYDAILPESGTFTKIDINSENESLLIVVTKDKCPYLKKDHCHCIDGLLSNYWWDWYYYEYEIPPSDRVLNLDIPQPYGKLAIVSRYVRSNNIKAEWLSDAELPVSPSIVKRFGGDMPPCLKIQSDFLDSNDKIIALAQFFDGCVSTEIDGEFVLENNSQIWKASETEFLNNVEYYINIRLYDMSEGSVEVGEFSCFWYPHLSIILPKHVLWTDEKCEIRLKCSERLLSENNVWSDIDNDFFSHEENEAVWTYPRKPSDCLPIITIKIQKFLDFCIKLPYISVWIQTGLQKQFEPHQLEWSNDRPFSYSFLEDLSQKDYKARLRFQCLSKKSQSVFLYNSSKNERIRQLFLEKNGMDSISCSELLKLDMIKDEATNRETYLFKKDEGRWSFARIYNEAKKTFLYKERFYFPKNGVSKI